MHPLLEKRDALCAEATELLDTILLPLLNEYGKVTIGGSYTYNLMSWPDIDLIIQSEDVSKEKYIELCTRLLACDEMSKFTTTDRVQFGRMIKTGQQTGYWIGLRFVYKKTDWSIDMWFMKPEWNADTTHEYKEKLADLDDETRVTILTLKNELLEKGLYGVSKEFQSVDVYNAVLEKGAKTIEDVRAYKCIN
jgi:hypothetical protein